MDTWTLLLLCLLAACHAEIEGLRRLNITVEDDGGVARYSEHVFRYNEQYHGSNTPPLPIYTHLSVSGFLWVGYTSLERRCHILRVNPHTAAVKDHFRVECVEVSRCFLSAVKIMTSYSVINLSSIPIYSDHQDY